MLDNNYQIKIKLLVLFLVIQIATFGLGIFSGTVISVRDTSPAPSLYSNYSEKQPLSPVEKTNQTTDTKTTNTPKGSTCTQIKGNISSKSKIYHVPGGSFYDRTQEEICFTTEQEAINAGFVKSSR